LLYSGKNKHEKDVVRRLQPYLLCPNRFQVYFMVTGRFRPSLLKKLFGRRLRSDFQCTSCIRSHHPRTLCNKMASYAARDLLAPSLPLHRNDTTDDGKIQCTVTKNL